ncbi:hypothetical protein B0T26DRAFT_803619 [Lasiosphaeria miniovina]|uniref:Uncharacterized protein n=1 Tax=Lasiosphaeria miniovina TaxID=1954250 RepID=A0AA40AAY6_9PEZI|nr:uncharacterized protein B0T26DRAFT_803619 [Lasiosphaeria miniovina]KAK0712575.1 hypothetical protein B0T26DRAFT_803619 [Lasiosphaeria miniovina]
MYANAEDGDDEPAQQEHQQDEEQDEQEDEDEEHEFGDLPGDHDGMVERMLAYYKAFGYGKWLWYREDRDKRLRLRGRGVTLDLDEIRALARAADDIELWELGQISLFEQKKPALSTWILHNVSQIPAGIALVAIELALFTEHMRRFGQLDDAEDGILSLASENGYGGNGSDIATIAFWTQGQDDFSAHDLDDTSAHDLDNSSAHNQDHNSSAHGGDNFPAGSQHNSSELFGSDYINRHGGRRCQVCALTVHRRDPNTGRTTARPSHVSLACGTCEEPPASPSEPPRSAFTVSLPAVVALNTVAVARFLYFLCRPRS